MVKTRSMRRVAEAPWSDLNHDVLLLIMMQLGLIDYVAFSGVCKSWRSFARDNRTWFTASRPPMHISFSASKKTCHLQDHGLRWFKTSLPQLAGRTCVGVTCGYTILFGAKTHDFWLVNPITRHKLHFPNVSFDVGFRNYKVRAILVYSPSLSAHVFLITNLFERDLWSSIEGKGTWNKFTSVKGFLDLHFYKGKIYTLIAGHPTSKLGYICEFTGYKGSEPKLRILETKNFPIPGLKWEFASSDEKLYLVMLISEQECIIYELDIGKMKVNMSKRKLTSEYVFFHSYMKSSAAFNPLSWADCCPGRFAFPLQMGLCWLITKEYMWYFPHDCFNVNRLEV